MSIHLDSYLVTEPGITPLRHLQWLSEGELDEAEAQFGPSAFDVRSAVEMLGDWLTEAVSGRGTADALTPTIVLDDFVGGDPGPEFRRPAEIEFEPTISADHRRQAITRYQRWSRLRELGAPSIMLRNEGRMLQATARAVLAAASDDSRPRTSRVGASVADYDLEPARSIDPVHLANPVPAWLGEQRA